VPVGLISTSMVTSSNSLRILKVPATVDGLFHGLEMMPPPVCQLDQDKTLLTTESLLPGIAGYCPAVGDLPAPHVLGKVLADLFPQGVSPT
jgi:hypothetical protein